MWHGNTNITIMQLPRGLCAYLIVSVAITTSKQTRDNVIRQHSFATYISMRAPYLFPSGLGHYHPTHHYRLKEVFSPWEEFLLVKGHEMICGIT